MANGHSGAAALVVPAERTSAAAARRFVLSTLEEWKCELLVDRAMLAVSEMVTNVILHARTTARVVVRRQPTGVRIEVHDGSPQLPQQKSYGADATTGRGLGMLDALCEDWGVAATPEGKVVWVELADESDGGPAEGAAANIGELSLEEIEALGDLEASMFEQAEGDHTGRHGGGASRRFADAWR